MVVLVVSALTVHSNNDTLDNNGSSLFCCHVILEGYKNVLGNGAVVGNGSGGAVGSGDGTCELVCMLFCCLLVYVDSPGRLALYCLNELVVNRPGNGVLNTCDHYLSNYSVVSRGNGVALLVERVNVLSCCFNVILCTFGLGGLSAFGLGGFVALGFGGLISCLLGGRFTSRSGSVFGLCRCARCKNRQAHKNCQNDCN